MEIDRPRWRLREWPIVASALLVAVLLLFIGGGSSDAGRWVGLAGNVIVTVLVLIWALRRLRIQRKRYEDELTRWAAQRAADAERLRVAGELHDLVSHGLGLITVRAAATRRMTGTDGETERIAALSDIEDAGRKTTTELRRMLTVLRTPGSAPLRPADTVNDLPAIVAAARASGLTVTLEAEHLPDISSGVQLTVCVIVREALNNTIRHSGPTRADVVVQHDGDSVLVDINDAGPTDGWTSHPGAGHGLTGLRERVAALGGALNTRQRTDGFHVAARLPDRIA